MTASSPARLAGGARLPGLDGLRAIAVIAVLLYHADYSWMSGGFLGVDLFFVLSGFLVTGLCLGEFRRTGSLGLRRFWARRARRLLPAQLALLTALVLFVFLFHRPELYELRGQVIAALTASANWYFFATGNSYFDAIGRPPVLRHMWSLAVEMQFYVFWPPLLLLLRRRIRSFGGLVATLLGGALLSALLLALWGAGSEDPSRAYFSTFSRLSGLLLGAALAVVWRPGLLDRAPIAGKAREVDRAALAALAVVIGFFVFGSDTKPWMYWVGFLTFSLVSVVLVAAASHPTAKAAGRRGFGHPFLVAIGARSYGIYLWHWPVYAFTRPGLDLSWGPTATLVLRLVLTGVLSEACYRFVEVPWHRGERTLADVRRWFSRPADGRLARPLGAGVMALAVAVSVVAMLVAPVHKDATVAAIEEGEDLIAAHNADLSRRPGPVAEVPARPAPTVPVTRPGETTTIPSFSSPGKVPVVTAIGDSVMVGAARGLYGKFGDNILIDAKVARQAKGVPDIVTSLRTSRGLGDVLVVHIGTNGTFSEEQIRAVKAAAGRTPVVFLTVRADRSWIADVNRTLGEVVPELPGAYLADWHGFSDAHTDWFRSDTVHLTDVGIDEYAEFVSASLTGRTPKSDITSKASSANPVTTRTTAPG